MNESYSLKDLMKQALINTTYILIGVIFGIALHKVFEKPIPKEEVIELENKVDSLQQVVNHLDSIKNVKIEEIKNLNDSATIALFYELISR